MQLKLQSKNIPVDPEDGILLKPTEVAEITRLSVSTVRQYIAAGILPVTRLGRRTFVLKAELLRWRWNAPANAANASTMKRMFHFLKVP
jgi:excisionase family DNA binding protein